MRRLITTLLLIAAFEARAEASTSIRLEPGNLSVKKRFLFLIQSTQTSNAIRFSVTAAPNASAASPLMEAYLMLFDGHGEIVRQPLQNLHGGGEAFRYEFEIASNLLTHSQFVLHELESVSIETPGSGDSFWFFLKDFVSAKPPSKRSARNARTAQRPLVACLGSAVEWVRP